MIKGNRMINLSRRAFFKKLAVGAAYVAVVASLPRVAWAKWSPKAFGAKDLNDAISAKYGDLPIIDSEQVKLKAPSIAENGRVVPISVKSDLDNVGSISLFVAKNPLPLATSLKLGKNSVADVSVRIRMAQTSEVIALVEADGKLHRASQLVKVTIGGCGG